MGEWDELYRENIIDHYKNPRCRGTLDHPDITYEDANPLCGDQLRIDIEVKDGKIEKIRHSGHELLGIELGPVRLKCALLILKTLKAGAYGITQWPGEEEEKA